MSRLFVAATPPPDVVAELVGATAAVRDCAPRLRWSPPQLWHLTLAFLGPVPEAVAPELGRRLADVASRHRPVPAAVVGAGRFGHRVLWLGVTSGLGVAGDSLPALAADVQRAAGQAGVTGLGTRPWQAHLTLARTPETVTADLAPLVDTLRHGDLPRWEINEITLMRSESGPRPTYTVVNGWPLTGSN